MRKAEFIILSVIIFVTILVYWFYGAYAFVFTPFFLVAFLFIFGLGAFMDSLQARSIPGIEKLAQPDFFFSRIFMAWLYVNDKKRWARYVASYSYVLGTLWGSLITAFFILPSGLEFNVLVVAWVFGMFLTLLFAIAVAKVFGTG